MDGFIIAGKLQVILSVQGKITIVPSKAAAEQVHRVAAAGQFIPDGHQIFPRIDAFKGIQCLTLLRDIKTKKTIIDGGFGCTGLHDDHIAPTFGDARDLTIVCLVMSIPENNVLDRFIICLHRRKKLILIWWKYGTLGQIVNFLLFRDF